MEPNTNTSEPVQPNFKGRGNHSVNELESICEKFQEYVSFINSPKYEPVSSSEDLFTKGEWEMEKSSVNPSDKEYWASCCVNRIGDNLRIALVYGHTKEEAEANAALIAEARNMLHSIRNFIQAIDLSGMYPTGKMIEVRNNAFEILNRINKTC